MNQTLRHFVLVIVATIVTLPAGISQSANPNEADLKAVAGLRSIHDAAAAAGSVEGVLKYYAADAVLMPPGQPAVEGKEAIRKWLNPTRVSSLGSPGGVGFEISGDTVYLFGTGQKMSLSAPALTSSSMWILKRQKDGVWLITRNIWN